MVPERSVKFCGLREKQVSGILGDDCLKIALKDTTKVAAMFSNGESSISVRATAQLHCSGLKKDYQKALSALWNKARYAMG